MKYVKFILPMLIIFLTIGYAATNVTLSITGDAYISSDLDDFEVYISNITLDGTENLYLLQDELTVKYTADISAVRDKPYEISVEMTNNSSSFDAQIAMSCNISNAVGIDLGDNIPEVIGAKNFDSYIIYIDTSNVTSSDGSISVSCSFTATPIERNELGEGEVPDKFQLLVGQEVSLGNEKFNIIKDNGDTVTMFAQYNLGTDYKQSTTENTVTFSDSAGWEYTPGPKEIDIQSYDGNAKIYVNEYVSYLKKLTGATSVSGDLITISQLGDLECTVPGDYVYGSGGWTCTVSKHSEWLVNGQYWWTRSAVPSYDMLVWIVGSNGSLNDSALYYYIDAGGIRPVITISKDVLLNSFISFTLDGTNYLALDGMNINEWLSSIYNYDSYYLTNGVIYNSDGSRKATLSGDTEITEGLTVEFTNVSGASQHSGGA